MLILNRCTDEALIIGDEITITILSVKGKQVRIGITAPPEVPVHREEVYRRIQDGEFKPPAAKPTDTDKEKDKAWKQHRAAEVHS